MKKITSILLFLFLITSCTSNTIFKKPTNLIPKNKMVDLLVDMQLALNAKSTKNKNGKRNINYMYLIYKKHGVDSTRFAESNFYYNTDVDQYIEILKEVKTKINQQKESLEKVKHIKDSLARAENPKLNKKKEIKPKKFKTKFTSKK